jgi:hypothetical protein
LSYFSNPKYKLWTKESCFHFCFISPWFWTGNAIAWVAQINVWLHFMCKVWSLVFAGSACLLLSHTAFPFHSLLFYLTICLYYYLACYIKWRSIAQ